MGWHSDNYNSTSTGNTESNPDHITGKDLIYNTSPDVISNMHKNIYDIAGNEPQMIYKSPCILEKIILDMPEK